MKNFVVKYGSIVISLIAFLSLAGLVISTITMFINQGLPAALTYCWLGIVSFIFVFFHIFLTISINENIKEIQDKLSCRV